MSNLPEPVKFYRTPAFIVAVIFLIVLVTPKAYKAIRWIRMNDDERFLDTASAETRRAQQDTIQLHNGKLVQEDFDSQYSAEHWYKQFAQNKVAFDKLYQDSVIDVGGYIFHIRSEDGCSVIELQGNDNPYDILVFKNCPEGTDKWADEVTQTSVGDKVHLRGHYDSGSSDFEMHIYYSHIIKP